MKTSGVSIGGTLRRRRATAASPTTSRDTWRRTRRPGLPIFALTLQNEPHHEPDDYPGMRLTPEQAGRVRGDTSGPAFARNGVRTQILDWDHNWDEPDSPQAVLADSAARQYVAGVAWHCYAGDVAAQSRFTTPTLTRTLYFTECSGGEWAPVWGDNLKWITRTLIIGSTRGWARGVLLWNLALDEIARSPPRRLRQLPWRRHGRLRTGAVSHNVEYYALGHAAIRHVRRPAGRVQHLRRRRRDVAFENPDGSIALLAFNAGAAPRTFKVHWRGSVQLHPAGRAVATFVWSGDGSSELPGGELDPQATYAIESVHSGNVLDVTDASNASGASVQQWDDFASANQRWRFESTGNGYWRIVSVASGKVLEVAEASTENGAPIRQWAYRGRAEQQWSVASLSDGTYSIINRLSGKALDVRDVSTDNGARIQQWDYFGSANQRWVLTPD